MKAPKHKSGDRITWIHYHLDGSIGARTGTVIDRAPRVMEGEHGADSTGCPSPAQHMNWWVKPDNTMTEDIHHTLAVGWARRDTYAHGRFVRTIWGNQAVFRDQLFSSDDRLSPLGRLEHRAALDAQKNRET